MATIFCFKQNNTRTKFLRNVSSSLIVLWYCSITSGVVNIFCRWALNRYSSFIVLHHAGFKVACFYKLSKCYLPSRYEISISKVSARQCQLGIGKLNVLPMIIFLYFQILLVLFSWISGYFKSRKVKNNADCKGVATWATHRLGFREHSKVVRPSSKMCCSLLAVAMVEPL